MGTDKKRFIELDLLRGLAITLMIFGHVLWDLDYFGLVPINNVLYSALQKIVPPMFFTIIGLSIIVGRKKNKLSIKEEKQYNLKLIKRGLKIFNLGMLLTIATIILIPDRPVYFGVLHCIGLTIILSIPFTKIKHYNLMFSVFFISLGIIVSQFTITNPNILQLSLGLHQADVWSHTVDYFPLLPWFGVTLLGIAIGNLLYDGEERRFKMPDISRFMPAKIFSWIGQHSLEIYLVHQPVIAGFLYIFLKTF